MRETHIAQASIFENYSKHEFGVQLKELSNILDQYPQIRSIISEDLIDQSLTNFGRKGLTVETVFRCLLLKQKLRISYEQLAFHLSDSITYRTFTRLPNNISPCRSTLQSTIRSIKPKTLEKVNHLLSLDWVEKNIISKDKIRIDSTVVKSDIAPPSDSQLLNDCIRVLSRFLTKSKDLTGIKLRFTDQRKKSKSLFFRIFNAKNAEKEVLYPELLKVMKITLDQVDRALTKIKLEASDLSKKEDWIKKVEHFKDLALKVVDQTDRRVIQKEKVVASEKIVSIFEEHTDIIVKGFRDVTYGHKINLSTECHGFITYLSIENGNTADSEMFLPVLDYHQELLNYLPNATVADGGYASQKNVFEGRAMGIKNVVFNKPVGISLKEMGVKKKTFKKLKNFRAGVEGNISELKRAFGAGKAMWKNLDGFEAYVWSSVLSYNLTRLARMNSG